MLLSWNVCTVQLLKKVCEEWGPISVRGDDFDSVLNENAVGMFHPLCFLMQDFSDILLSSCTEK